MIGRYSGMPNTPNKECRMTKLGVMSEYSIFQLFRLIRSLQNARVLASPEGRGLR